MRWGGAPCYLSASRSALPRGSLSNLSLICTEQTRERLFSEPSPRRSADEGQGRVGSRAVSAERCALLPPKPPWSGDSVSPVVSPIQHASWLRPIPGDTESPDHGSFYETSPLEGGGRPGQDVAR